MCDHNSMARPNKYIWIIVIIFVISRVYYFNAGVRFNVATLYYYSGQILDPQLLQGRLLQSLFYLHCQPPLFNFFLGVILKLFPGYEIIAFKLFYLGLGLLLGISLFLLMRRLKIPDTLSTALTCVFIASPSCILFENELFYTYFVTILLITSALFLHRYLSRGKILDAMVFFFLLASLILIRNVFHLLWFVLVAAVVFISRKNDRERLILAFSLPFVLVFFVYAKNFHLFGYPAASTSFGMSFYHVATGFMPDGKRRELVNKSNGKISELSLLPPIPTLKPLDNYPEQWTRVSPTGIPVLDRRLKSNNKDTNFNHIAYAAIGTQLTKDALRIIVSEPRYYVRSVLYACYCYLLPAEEYFFGEEDMGLRLSIVPELYDIIIYGRFAEPFPKISEKEAAHIYYAQRISLFLFIGLPILAVFGLMVTIKSLIKKPLNKPFALTMLFIMLSILQVTMVANLFSMGENMRHRFVTDPFYLTLLGLLINGVYQKLKG